MMADDIFVNCLLPTSIAFLKNKICICVFKAALTRTSSQTLDAKGRASKQRRRLWLAKVLDQVPSGKGHRVRESLTKKLYAGGGGSRKTWDRDWDISFWKEQSARLKKARKEATDTLEGRGKNGRAREVKATSSAVKEDEAILGFSTTDTDTDDSVLTRLYVADTSLFARDNDIKPVCLHSSTKEKELGQRDGEKGMSSGGTHMIWTQLASVALLVECSGLRLMVNVSEDFVWICTYCTASLSQQC